MAKGKNSVPKSGAVWRMSGVEAALSRKPRYNPYACGTGVHGDTKYNRAKERRRFRNDLENG